MTKLQLLSSLSPAALRLVDKHTRGTIAPSADAATVVHALLAKGLPNQPKVSAQASLRLEPATALLAYGWKHKLIDADVLVALGRWPVEEESWRNLSKGGPPVAVAREAELMSSGEWACTGPEILNDAGDPQPVELAEGQHFTLRYSALLAAITGDGLSFAHAMALLDWLYAQSWTKVENQRHLGFCLEAAHDIWTLTRAVRAEIVAHRIVNRIWDQSLGVPPGGSWNGIPWLTLNTAMDPDDSGEGSGKADHGWCRIWRWGTARITTGLGDWSRDIPTWKKAKQLHQHGLLCEVFAMKMGEALGGPLGSGVDDWDPTGATWPTEGFFHEVKPQGHGVMDAFCVAADASSEDLQPAQWSSWFQPRLVAQYQANSRYRMNTSKLPDHHSASAALLLAGANGAFA